MKRISALHSSKGIWLALMGLCLFGLASCDKDEVEEAGLTGNGRPVTVRLSISAGSLRDLNATRAAGDDANAAEHEFMNTLYVYIVDAEGNLEYIINNPLADNAEAATGDATTGDCYEYTQDIKLTPGTKTIYAFSNIDLYKDGEKTGKELLEECFGDVGSTVSTESTDALQSFCVDDPAGKIDFKSMFLPMSALEEVTVDASTSEISIELVRLVSKVNITLPTDGIPTGEDSQLTFSGYADRVPLLESRTAEGISREKERTFSLKDYDGQTISFYVNATPEGEPFKVSLTANSTKATVTSCESQTERTDLPRNSIYPLKLTFEDEPEFSIRGWVAAIGSTLSEFKVVYDEKTHHYKIAEGTSRFEFKVTGVTSSEAILQSVVWSKEKGTYSDFFGENPDDKIEWGISGYISASGIGMTCTYNVKVTWKTSQEGNTVTRIYKIVVETIDLMDIEYYP